MKNLLLAAAAAFVMLPTLCLADTLKFPSDAPVAQITIPASWDPEETETGIQATSEDSAIYLSIDVADQKTSDQVIDDAIKFLDDNGVDVDGATQKRSEDEFNGMEMTTFGWDGTDKDGPVNIGLSLVSPKPGKLLVITYWGTRGEQEKHGPELMKIINSLKPAGR